MEISQQYSKIIFNEEGKALIYRHTSGQENLNWIFRTAGFITLLSMWLLLQEIRDPFFGKMNQFCFGFFIFLGLSTLTVVGFYGRRIINTIHIHKSGEKLDIGFLGLKQRTLKTYYTSEFGGMEHSYGGFYVTESIKDGKYWFYPEANEFRSFPDYENMAFKLMDGQNINFSTLDRKMKRFK